MKAASHVYPLILCSLLGCCYTGLYAQKPLRSTWAQYKKPASLPATWKRMSPMRAWKYPIRPRIMESFFPTAAVSNRTVWNIPLSSAVARAYTKGHSVTPLVTLGVKGPRPFPGKQEIDAVIFDLDGTLLDSLSAWEHSGSNFVRSQGFEPSPELDAQLVKMSLLDGAQLIKDQYHLPYTLQEIVERTLLPIKNHYYQDIQAMPGVPEVLARLKAQGVKMAVATASYKEFAQVALARLGLADYFDLIITCDEVGIGKTSPRVYEVAAAQLGVSKQRTLVAEDALHALQTAHQAGFKTAAIEEIHSAHQQHEKQSIADYYVFSYQGANTFYK